MRVQRLREAIAVDSYALFLFLNCLSLGLCEMSQPLNPTYIKKLHCLLFRGTVADQDGILEIGEYRKTPDKFGVAAPAVAVALNSLLDEYERKTKIIVGHADIDMTKHYLHVQEPKRQEAVELFSKTFGTTEE